MKKILITGALGQIGSEITELTRKIYGYDNVIHSDVHERTDLDNYEMLDVRNSEAMYEVIKKHKVDSVLHLAALLSATGEKNPGLLWDVNMNGLYNVLEIARQEKLSVFTPSSIAAFGANTPRENTPQDTIQRPSTIYGVSKVSGELLCDYYYTKFGVDARGVRYPGLISNGVKPGGGTTDYAVHIYYEAVKERKYTSYIAAGTKMDMMYMPDALDAIIQLMEADPSKLIHRNAFNITAMSFDPEVLKAAITKYIPDFKMDYDVDPVRQKIAESWPDSLDDSAARQEWGWNPKFDLDTMTKDMLDSLSVKLGVKY